MAGDLALENIEEFLFDEDRVVSYKWLSKTLSMHVNQAKSKLEEFAENWREKPGSKPITLTFFISGIQETTSGNELTKVAIVKEEDLENVKKNLKKTLCEHIYSIQKTALKDTAVLYQTDFDETKQHLSECNKYSAIKCKSVQTRSADSLVPIVSSVPNGRVSSVPNGRASPAEETKEKVGSSKATAVPEKKKGLAAFVKQQKTQDKNETKQAKVSPLSEKKPSSTAKKGSLMHAFQSSKKALPKSQTVAKEDTESPKDEEESKKEDHSQEDEKTVPSSTKEDEAKSKESDVQKKDKDQKKDKEEKLETKKGVNSSKKSSKRDISDSDSESESKTIQHKGTKRRRVIQEDSSSEDEESDHEMMEEQEEEVEMVIQEDSSSEDEESDHEMMEEQEEEVEMDDTPIPPTPEIKSKGRQEEESVSPSTQEGNTEEGKKGRKKVWKKKRYLDEDGCMVTDTVFDYESGEGSDDEKETEGPTDKTSSSTNKDQSPKNGTSSSPSTDTSSKKESPPSSGRKQTALTSFFKKR